MSAFGAGTRSYMPPEQFVSIAAADTRSDIFSFGVMLHEMLTSQRLFAAESAYELALTNRPLPQAHEIKPAVSRRLSAVISRCVQYDPVKRYQSFHELAADLWEIQASLPDALPIPHDASAIPAEALTPSLQALGQSYSLISLGRFKEAAASAQQGIDLPPRTFNTG